MRSRRAVTLRGEAVTLWRLARGADCLHCFVVEPPHGFWLGVEQGAELVFSQTYDTLDGALLGAHGLKAPLVTAGWRDVADH